MLDSSADSSAPLKSDPAFSLLVMLSEECMARKTKSQQRPCGPIIGGVIGGLFVVGRVIGSFVVRALASLAAAACAAILLRVIVSCAAELAVAGEPLAVAPLAGVHVAREAGLVAPGRSVRHGEVLADLKDGGRIHLGAIAVVAGALETGEGV